MASGIGGNVPQVVSTRVVALYRETDGRVVHLHTVRVFEGGRAVSREEAESTARANAARHGHEASRLEAYHCAELPPGNFGSYHVDASTGRLVGKNPVSPSRPERTAR